MILRIDDSTVLKRLEESDTAYIFTAIDNQREFLGKWLPFVALTKDISVTAKFVDSVINAPEDRPEYTFTIWKNGVFAGLIGLKTIDNQNKRTEIGYWLSEEFQKQGIMTRAVSALCEFAFGELGLNRIQIKCAVGNIPSKNIPQRLGFKFEGIERDGELLDDGYTDIEVYSKLKSEFVSTKDYLVGLKSTI